MKHSILFLIGFIPLFIFGCNAPKKTNSNYGSSDKYQQEVVEVAKQQLGYQTKVRNTVEV